MRSGWSIPACGLLLAVLAGCSHRLQNATPLPAAQAPSFPPREMAELMPMMPQLPPNTAERPVLLNTENPPNPSDQAAAHPRKTRHHPKPAQDTAQTPAKPAATPSNSPDTAEVALGPPPDASPIGQLSTASSNANTADWQALTDQINATENNLNGISRSLNGDEQKTAVLIRTFLAKARQALKTDDLDGAQKFTTKAKILLQELMNNH
jgi:hypothetical protein